MDLSLETSLSAISELFICIKGLVPSVFLGVFSGVFTFICLIYTYHYKLLSKFCAHLDVIKCSAIKSLVYAVYVYSTQFQFL